MSAEPRRRRRTRPTRPRPSSTHPSGRVPSDLGDALGHLNQERHAVRTVYIDDYAIDDYGVEQIDQPGNEAVPVDRHARDEVPRQRPVLWPAVALVILVVLLAILLTVL